MPAAPANKNTESWPQGGSKTETAWRLQKQDRQRILFYAKKEVAKTDPKMGPPRGPIFVTVQSKIWPDKRSPRFLLHRPRARMTLAPLNTLRAGHPLQLASHLH